MLVLIDVLLSLLLGHLGAEILHDLARLILCAYVQNGSELAALDQLPFQRRPDPDYNSEIRPAG